MDLNHCLKVTTNRQYLSWLEHLRQDWNSPNLICYYLMQLTATVASLFSKTPISSEKFKIKFTFDNQTENEDRELTEAEKAQITMQSKSRWGLISGLFAWNKRKQSQPPEMKIPK